MPDTSIADAALARLLEGNQRFVADARKERSHAARRAEVRSEQRPFAVVLGCADSRVPAELVFDQGLGDLFVIRVAGNIVAPSQIGSVEFAAEQLGSRLVMVLGHTRCGAVAAALGEGDPAGAVFSIVRRVREAIGDTRDPGRAIEANVRASVRTLLAESDLLRSLAGADGLRVVGAVYDLESGRVRLIDGD